MSATAARFSTRRQLAGADVEGGPRVAEFLEINPMIAHVGFVEAYAVGPGAVQRVEDSHVTFTIFLQEGLQHANRRTPPPRGWPWRRSSRAIFEIVYRGAREREPAGDLRSARPHGVPGARAVHRRREGQQLHRQEALGVRPEQVVYAGDGCLSPDGLVWSSMACLRPSGGCWASSDWSVATTGPLASRDRRRPGSNSV